MKSDRAGKVVQESTPSDLIISLGAGDVYKLGEQILLRLDATEKANERV